jgi:prepilin-type N-terminal cleavage/methylation domain-containing protein
MSMPRIKQNAFTLVEMLAVIVIIALLAATIIPAIIKAKNNGEAARCKGNLKSLYQACLNCANDGGSIPAATPSEGVNTLGTVFNYNNAWVSWTVNSCVTNSLATLWTGPNLTDSASHAGACDRALWWGQAGVYSIRYGGIWDNCGQAIGTYLCPTFSHQAVCGRSDAVRSYVMNTKAGGCNPLVAANASRTLLFTDMQPQQQYLGSPSPNICLTWAGHDANGSDGALDPDNGGAMTPTAAHTQPYESMGFIHNMNGGYYAQCVFLDGHIEAIAFISTNNLTYALCSGQY